MEHCDLDLATEFLLIASTLVELKSRRLLPVDDDVDLDDELALWEERDLLLSRLLECKTFKDAAVVLRRLHRDGARSYPRLAGIEEQFVSLAPDLLAGVGPDDVRRAYVQGPDPTPAPGRPVPRRRHQGQRGRRHRGAGRRAAPPGPDHLPALTSSLVERIEVVVRFLGILELFKAGLVELDQVGQFGDIHIVWLGPEDDRRPRTEVLESIDVYEG